MDDDDDNRDSGASSVPQGPAMVSYTVQYITIFILYYKQSVVCSCSIIQYPTYVLFLYIILNVNRVQYIQCGRMH